MPRCAVIGAGSWGTAIARHLARQGHSVHIWAHSPGVSEGISSRHTNPRYLSDVTLPDSLQATSDLATCLEGAEAAIFVVPSSHLRAVARRCASLIDPQTPVLVLTKGIEYETSRLMTQVVSDELGNPLRTAALSGPNLAAEIARDKPAATVIAAPTQDIAAWFQKLFHSEHFRTYISTDVTGVEVCGAAKNVVAIASGITHGVIGSDNAAALVMTRGLAEMGRLVVAMGGNPLTCMGLAGVGDLIATCTSPRSRNFSFGVGFAQGETVEQYTARTHMTVEGYFACKSIVELSRRLNVEVPLSQAVYGLLYEGRTVESVVASLYAREPRAEMYGIDSFFSDPL